MEIVVIGILGLLLIVTHWVHWRERGDLLDRLAARDYPELVTWRNEEHKTKNPDKFKREDENLVPI